MSAHDAHDHVGNDPRQILKDGCAECERRGADPLLALGHMDPDTFRRAMARAITWQTQRNYTDTIGIPSATEALTLLTIWTVLVSLRAALPMDVIAPMRSEWGGSV